MVKSPAAIGIVLSHGFCHFEAGQVLTKGSDHVRRQDSGIPQFCAKFERIRTCFRVQDGAVGEAHRPHFVCRKRGVVAVFPSESEIDKHAVDIGGIGVVFGVDGFVAFHLGGTQADRGVHRNADLVLNRPKGSPGLRDVDELFVVNHGRAEALFQIGCEAVQKGLTLRRNDDTDQARAPFDLNSCCLEVNLHDQGLDLVIGLEIHQALLHALDEVVRAAACGRKTRDTQPQGQPQQQQKCGFAPAGKSQRGRLSGGSVHLRS